MRKLMCLLTAMLLISIGSVTVGAASVASPKIQSYGAIGTTPSGDIPLITINGTDFILDGKPYIFRGVNIQFTGLHHPESGCQPISSTTFDLLKSWNVNLIRVWLDMEMASPSYGSWTQSFFDKVQQVIDLAEQYRIYILIEPLMQYNIGPSFSGTGFPTWMFSGITSQSAAWDMFYKAIVQKDSTYQNVYNAIREYIHRVVSLTKDRNIVMGYDIFNEPEFKDFPPYNRLSASYFYEGLSPFYTEIDPVKPQCIENNFVDNNYKPNIPNLFVQAHGYAGHTHDYTASQLRSYFTTSDYWVQGPRWNVPTMNGEWFLGTQSEAQSYGLTASDIAAWYDRYMTAMEGLGISWAVLRCEANFSQMHWTGDVTKNVILNHFVPNTVP